MGIETSKKEDRGPIVIKVMNYENLDVVLSKIIVPFSKLMETSSVPDVYMGHEKIPFEKRYPLYQTIMRQEFASAVKVLKSEIPL